MNLLETVSNFWKNISKNSVPPKKQESVQPEDDQVKEKPIKKSPQIILSAEQEYTAHMRDDLG